MAAERLLALGELWSAEVKAGACKLEDCDPLEGLVAELREGLEAIAPQAGAVAALLRALSDQDFDGALASLGQAAAAPAGAVTSLGGALDGFSPRAAAIAACDYVHGHASGESQQLQDALERFERGEAAAIDARSPFACALMLLLVGAGVVRAAGLGRSQPAVTPLSASQTGLGAVAWSDAGCAQVVRELTRSVPAHPPQPQPVAAPAPDPIREPLAPPAADPIREPPPPPAADPIREPLAPLRIVRGHGWVEVNGIRVPLQL